MEKNFEDLQPVLLRKLNIEAAGKNAKALIGDVNGDGRMELVMVQADGGIDDRYVPHKAQCITVYDLNGNILWQFGKAGFKEGTYGLFGSDFPAQIADIDDDGQNEVLCVMNYKFYVLNGIDGSIKNEYELPDSEAHDCIIVANLRGNKKPQDIILKNRYKKMWALDNNFNLLWEHTGNLGHFPYVYDFNNDGKDEVMAGYDMLDSEGNIIWSCKDLIDHADCISVVRYSDEDINIVIGGSGKSTVMYDKNGKEIWRYTDAVEAQHIAVGKFRRDIDGIQVAGLDRIVRGDLDGKVNDKIGKDGIFLLDDKGREIAKEHRKTNGWLTIIEPFRNWAGKEQDYILAYRRGGNVMPALYNGNLEPVATFSKEGYVVHGQLLNDGNEFVIIYSDGEAEIYAHKNIDLDVFKQEPIEETKRLSHSTLYPGNEIEIDN